MTMKNRLLASLMLLSAGFSFAHAEEAKLPESRPTCAEATVVADTLRQRLEQARATLAGLATFVAGESLGEIPAASLFIVDLADEKAIERRLDALRAFRNSPPPQAVDCAAQYPELAAEVTAMTELQAEINRLRLEFLSLPRARREALVNAQQSLLVHAESASELAREQAVAERQQSESSLSLENAEQQARSAATAHLREIAAQRAVLEKAREDLAGIQIQFSSDLRARADMHGRIAERLSGLAATLTQASTADAIARAYEESAGIWRGLVDQIFARIADPGRYEPIPRLPALSVALLARAGDEAVAADYRAAHLAAVAEHKRLSVLRQQRYAEERNNVFRLFLAASKLRSELLKENVARGNARVTALSEAYFADLYREVRIVPYRLYAFVTTTYIDFREQARGGFDGLFNIARQVMIFALFVALPFLVYQALRRAVAKLESLRYRMLREQLNLPEARQRAARLATIAIQRVNAYLPWAVMLAAIWLAESLVADTVFADVAAVLPYIAYYIWYRIFVTAVASGLGIIAYSGAMQSLTTRRKRVQRMAQRVGAFFFIALALRHATQDVVGEALVYQLVVAAMIYLGLVICAVAARHWRAEIAAAARRALPAWAATRIERYCAGRLSWFVCLPALILVVAGLTVRQIHEWASQTDALKRVTAELFRRRVESATQDKGGSKASAAPPPDDYLAWFDLGAPADATLIVEPSTGITTDVLEAVETWKRTVGGEHSLALVGDKGSGKSSLLRVIEHVGKDCSVVKITVPPKLVTREAVLAFFSEQLGLDLSRGAETLVASDAMREQTLILVDEAHNLFFAAIGGFAGYRAFMELVNAGTANLFWCAAFNRRAWDYLLGVFGSNQYFRNALPVPPMSDADIQKLILTRHRRTGYAVSYDAIIRATQSPEEYGGMAQIETQFFRLLWGQSKGNPRAAIVLWRSALHAAGGKHLKVGIPRYKPIKGLEKVGDDALFVYAAILRHENLTAEEVIATTDLAPGVVHDALRVGIDCEAIARGEDRRYRASPTAQFALVQLLMGKNFIHE